jgi:hypothetical protein
MMMQASSYSVLYSSQLLPAPWHESAADIGGPGGQTCWSFNKYWFLI